MTRPDRTERALSRYQGAWRWHFLAGVLVIPFLLVLATTGLVMVYYSTVQTPLGERGTARQCGYSVYPCTRPRPPRTD